MPEHALWPQGLVWGLHDFNLSGAQRLSTFRAMIDRSYGGADNAADWVALAQFINYDGYRAMFEAQGRNRMGLLLWMSHPCWPSLAWQTYDYYFDQTAAYYREQEGVRADSHPVESRDRRCRSGELQRRQSDGPDRPGRAAEHGRLGQVEEEGVLDSPEDSVLAPIRIEYPTGLTPVHFIRLKLTHGARMLSENFYWRGIREGDYRALRSLPKVQLEATTRVDRRGSRWILTTTLHNASRQPALMVRVTAVREKSGDRILPALHSDNYVALMPGERRTVRTEIEDADTRGEHPRIVVTGFNVWAPAFRVSVLRVRRFRAALRGAACLPIRQTAIPPAI